MMFALSGLDVWQVTYVAIQQHRSSQMLASLTLAFLTVKALTVGRHHILCFLVSAWSFTSFKCACFSVLQNLQHALLSSPLDGIIHGFRSRSFFTPFWVFCCCCFAHLASSFFPLAAASISLNCLKAQESTPVPVFCSLVSH